jgi:hypothetical protein
MVLEYYLFCQKQGLYSIRFHPIYILLIIQEISQDRCFFHSTEKLTGWPWPFFTEIFIIDSIFYVLKKKKISIYFCKYLTSSYTIINWRNSSLAYILKFNFSSPFFFSFQQWLSLLKHLVVKAIGAKVRFQPNIKVGCTPELVYSKYVVPQWVQIKK